MIAAVRVVVTITLIMTVAVLEYAFIRIDNEQFGDSDGDVIPEKCLELNYEEEKTSLHNPHCHPAAAAMAQVSNSICL